MEHFSSEQPINKESLADIVSTTIEELIQTIPPELTSTSLRIADLLKNSTEDTEQLQDLWSEWANQIEAYVDSIEHAKLHAEAHIAAIVNKAFIFQLAGNPVRYLEELDDAAVYAANEGFEAVASSLTVEIDNNVEALTLTPEKVVLKLRGIISDANRLYLKELISEEVDLEEIISAAYGMILEDGGDPDEVLARIGVTE